MTATSKWIDIQAADGTFGAYLSLPRGGKGPGIVLIQEIFGVNAHIRSVADQYAADGYVVLVPDLFWRSGPRIELDYEEAGWKRAVELMQATDNPNVLADLDATVKTLRALPGVEGKIASIGYCFGGRLSYQVAAQGWVDTAIAYYGGGIQNKLDLADQIKVPLLMHFGGQDSHIPNDAVQKIAERFEDHPEVEIHIYPGAEHGFNCSHRASYQQRAAAQSHGNSLLFLAENL
ncbi:dienelactone hydrolase family protein [Janthinobacterium agaricidamnosum]|uniref:Dienelactone hydrolase family protein n=1 Tax=Janthinobacterium agaricidamnosum NBRC 102515 = DSM 9628 TaxID=1349767 RepID=W0VCG0_9BURK|nr:dienelactone hydrolase family protein [Janthinobacterium agaricidamnosum]CDG85355.1 dienelactone hydrolase family protein [Janthinobacterium agaricidamnosum NBRC 102515 = DSM 9628]